MNMTLCPKCQGPMWDNRLRNEERKAQGLKPTPDFKCKNLSCGGVIWPPKNGAIPVSELPIVTSETPAIEQKTKELTEIANVIKSESMLVCNAMNNACVLLSAGTIKADQLEATFERILRILESKR